MIPFQLTFAASIKIWINAVHEACPKNKIGNHLFLENDNFHKQSNEQKIEANGCGKWLELEYI